MKIFNNPVKRKLGKNELVVGSWMAMSHPWVADIMGQCGFEFLVVELEHSTVELESLNSRRLRSSSFTTSCRWPG